MADEKRGEEAAGSSCQAGNDEQPATGRIDINSIRQLLELMREHDLAEIEIEQEDLAVRLRKAGAAPATVTVAPGAAMAGPAPAALQPAAAPAAAKEEEAAVFIKSPMVGTFYVAPSPDAEPYVKVGDHVAEDTVVCTVEAMKVYNEIRAEVSGTIERVLVKNAEAVEFGKPMFAVRPD